MSLRFAYRPVSLKGPPGAAHPSGATRFWRPFVEVRIIGPQCWYDLPQALIDTGAQDTVFPWDLQAIIGAQLRPDAGYVLRWRGTVYPLRFADVELQLAADGSVWRWPALVGFSPHHCHTSCSDTLGFSSIWTQLSSESALSSIWRRTALTQGQGCDNTPR
jgi:hypothetical protein